LEIVERKAVGRGRRKEKDVRLLPIRFILLGAGVGPPRVN